MISPLPRRGFLGLALLAAACGDNLRPADPDGATADAALDPDAGLDPDGGTDAPTDASPDAPMPTVGDAFAVTSTGRLVSFGRATPGTLATANALTGLLAAESVVGIDVRPADGVLYALTSAGRVYTLDPATGVATLRATLTADPADATLPYAALVGTSFGVDWNPVVDRLRVVSDLGQNLRINVDTGLTTTDDTINGAATGYTSAAYTKDVAVACRTTLFAIDAASDWLLIQNPPNNGVATAVGTGLGVDATASAGFDIATDAASVDTALAALTVAGTSGLYTIDLTAGTATLRGALALDVGETVRGLALTTLPAATAVVQAPGELYGLTDNGRLISFNRAAPARPCTSAAIGGLAAGDVAVGLDFRPSTGALHALTNNAGVGKLYTIDPATAAATAPVTLGVALLGTEFGMDFNPTGPVALRIVSDAGQNLRVTDVAAGTTTTDGAINGAGTSASGAAYTDAVPGAGTTALYTLDATADRLRLQSPPNAGTQVDVGALGVDVTGLGGFDIDGRDNVAFVAAELAGATASTLHTVNLATGALSASLGTIGGGQRLRGLTRPTPTTTVFGLTDTNGLVRVPLADPSMTTAAIQITGLTAGDDLLGLDVRPSTGALHVIGALGGVYTVDPATGAATRLSTLSADPTDLTAPYTGLTGTNHGVDFNPTGAVALRVVSDAEQNLRVPNVATGATFTDTALARAPRTYTLTAAAYANNLPGATSTTLYALDATGDRLVAVNTPNSGTVRELGPVGLDVEADSLFEIVGPGTAVAVLDGGGTRTLVNLDLATGAGTAVGTIATAGTLVGLAAPATATAPAADSTLYALTAAGTLLSFPRNAPGTVTTIGTVTVGLLETIVGLDVRPSTGELWVLTSGLLGAGRLYTVNPTTAATTLRATLAADAADTTAPFGGLIGTQFAMDFNPTGAVALRIFGATGQNLRVTDPTTGATFTDTDVGTPAPDVAAAAYSNSFPAPAGVTLTTSLYVIDLATASLLAQAPPNDGTLTPIGALSASLTFVGTGGLPGAAAFDIAGGNNGIALAALRRHLGGVPESSSRLYRINLATGVATEVGNGIGGVPLRGLAVQIR